MGSKSSMLRHFASRSSLVISFLKRDATLKAIEAFAVLPVSAKSLPLKNVVRAISFLCAFGSTDQMSRALLVIDLNSVRSALQMSSEHVNSRCIFALTQTSQMLRYLVVDDCCVEVSFPYSCPHVAQRPQMVLITFIPLALRGTEVPKYTKY